MHYNNTTENIQINKNIKCISTISSVSCFMGISVSTVWQKTKQNNTLKKKKFIKKENFFLARIENLFWKWPIKTYGKRLNLISDVLVPPVAQTGVTSPWIYLHKNDISNTCWLTISYFYLLLSTSAIFHRKPLKYLNSKLLHIVPKQTEVNRHLSTQRKSRSESFTNMLQVLIGQHL